MDALPLSSLNIPAGSAVPRRMLAFRFVCIPLGLLVLAAAYLKFRDLTWEPFGKALIIPPRLRILLVEAEALLGLWLLTGLAPRALWAVSTLVFAAFSAVNVFLITNGDPTCGCFGKTAISPWVALSLDAAALVALFLTRPRIRQPDSAVVQARSSARAVLLWGGVTFFVIFAIQLVRHGGVSNAWAGLLSQSVVIEPSLADVGSGLAGDSATFTVTLSNRSDRLVRIIGGSDDCRANAAIDLPQTVAPGESCVVRIRGYFKGSPGRFVREYQFLTDHPTDSVLVGRYTSTVILKE
jgi:hypothetical protein